MVEILDFDLDEEVTDNYYGIKNKAIMTEMEIKWFKLFEKLISDDFFIWPQINLASIMDIEAKYQQKLFHNIDFGIFRKTDFKLMLLIETNDFRHKKEKGFLRDKKVSDCCKMAGYPFIKLSYSQIKKETHIKKILNARGLV